MVYKPQPKQDDKKQSKMKNIFAINTLWLITNSALYCLAYFGTIGSLGAKNLFVFLVTIFSVSSILIALTLMILPEKEKSKIIIPKKQIPLSIDLLVDLGLIIFVVWNGWFFCGTILFLAALATIYIFKGFKSK